mgnify:CR=1 FL=1
MEPVIDHIQITVRDLDAAAAFYDRLMPLLGFDSVTVNVSFDSSSESGMTSRVSVPLVFRLPACRASSNCAGPALQPASPS